MAARICCRKYANSRHRPTPGLNEACRGMRGSAAVDRIIPLPLVGTFMAVNRQKQNLLGGEDEEEYFEEMGSDYTGRVYGEDYTTAWSESGESMQDWKFMKDRKRIRRQSGMEWSGTGSGRTSSDRTSSGEEKNVKKKGKATKNEKVKEKEEVVVGEYVRKLMDDIDPDVLENMSLMGWKFCAAMDTIREDMKILSTLIEGSYRIKAEIKHACRNVESDMARIMEGQIRDWWVKRSRLDNLEDPEMKDVEVQTMEGQDGEKKVKTSEVGTQTMSWEDGTLAVKEKLRDVKTFQDVERLCRRRWSEGVYERTKVVVGDLSETCGGVDEVFMVDVSEEKDNRSLGKLTRTRPQLKGMIDAGFPSVGKVGYLESNGMMEDGGDMIERRYTFMVGANKKDMKKCYEGLEKLRGYLERRGKNKVVMGSCVGIDYGLLRKLVECSFHRSTIDIEIHVPWERGKQEVRRGLNTERQRQIQVIEVKGQRRNDGTYADILKEMRREVNVEEHGVQVRSIQCLRDGAVRINTLEKREGGCKSLSAAIQEKVSGVSSTTVKGREIGVIIRDLDSATTEEEIRKGIRRSVRGLEDEEVVIEGIRPTRGLKEKIAMVRMKRDAGLILVGLRRITVGWLRCRVDERVEPVRCYRCHKFGHFAGRCMEKEEEVRRELCLRCGQEGHRVKECTGKEYCMVCKVEGHRMDRMWCPVYRQLVEEEKKKCRMKRGWDDVRKK